VEEEKQEGNFNAFGGWPIAAFTTLLTQLTSPIANSRVPITKPTRPSRISLTCSPPHDVTHSNVEVFLFTIFDPRTYTPSSPASIRAHGTSWELPLSSFHPRYAGKTGKNCNELCLGILCSKPSMATATGRLPMASQKSNHRACTCSCRATNASHRPISAFLSDVLNIYACQHSRQLDRPAEL
jgi:hypothetical protein